MTTEDHIQSRLNRSKYYVFTRDDFRDIVGYDQAGRAPRTLVSKGKLMKVDYGIYIKARRNIITGKIMPATPGGSTAVITEVLECLSIRYYLAGATECYNKGQSTQIPVSLRMKTPSRFKRVLIVGKSKINA